MSDEKYKTMVFMASPFPDRYSYKAVKMLLKYGHPVVPLGIRDGSIEGIPIIKGLPQIDDIHTVTLYLSPINQTQYIDYILGLKPKRIIFNPDTEHEEFLKRAELLGIEAVEYCTLMMLTGGFF